MASKKENNKKSSLWDKPIPKWWPFNDRVFDIFFNAFLLFAGATMAVAATGVGGWLVYAFLIVSLLFVLMAMITLQRQKQEPKDTRLDTIIQKLDKLGESIDKLSKEVHDGFTEQSKREHKENTQANDRQTKDN